MLANGALTMQYLTQTANIPKELLHRMQPDITAWLKAGRVSLEKVPCFQHRLDLFAVNFFRILSEYSTLSILSTVVMTVTTYSDKTWQPSKQGFVVMFGPVLLSLQTPKI